MNNQFALIAQTISIWQYILSSFPWWEAWHTEVRWLFPGCSPPQSHVKVKFSAPWWFILSHTWVNHCLSTWMFIARHITAYHTWCHLFTCRINTVWESVDHKIISWEFSGHYTWYLPHEVIKPIITPLQKIHTCKKGALNGEKKSVWS